MTKMTLLGSRLQSLLQNKQIIELTQKVNLSKEVAACKTLLFLTVENAICAMSGFISLVVGMRNMVFLL